MSAIEEAVGEKPDKVAELLRRLDELEVTLTKRIDDLDYAIERVKAVNRGDVCTHCEVCIERADFPICTDCAVKRDDLGVDYETTDAELRDEEAEVDEAEAEARQGRT